MALNGVMLRHNPLHLQSYLHSLNRGHFLTSHHSTELIADMGYVTPREIIGQEVQVRLLEVLNVLHGVASASW